MAAPLPVTGVILSGGLGTRMGGVDKGLQMLQGMPLVAWVVRALQPQVETLVINANRNPESYGIYGFPVVADSLSDYPGPLAGLHAGLMAAQGDWVVTCPCDSPFLPQDLVFRLWESLHQQQGDLAVAATAEGLQPVFCLCPKGLLSDLQAYLEAGGRKMGEWCKRHKLAVADFDDQTSAFRNINRLEELQAYPSPTD